MTTPDSRLRGNNNKKKKNSGFSLIELLVALAVFSIVIITAIGIFTVVINGHRKISSQQAVIESGRFLLEFVSKEVRFSEVFSTSGATTTVSIQNSEGESISYSFDNVQGILSRNGIALNNENIRIDGQFYVSGNEGAFRPLVSVIMKVSDRRAGMPFDTSANLQTSVSPRRSF